MGAGIHSELARWGEVGYTHSVRVNGVIFNFAINKKFEKGIEMLIGQYMDKIKRAGVQSYYGYYCYAQNIPAEEALTNRTPNSEYICWITEKHRVFRQEKLRHNSPYSKEEQEKFFTWIKEEAIKEREAVIHGLS